ncbi:hypothetical protein BC749_102184 [Flavobacterium araucananum]|jgi:hypothetical protein|uniref:Uncharacterized protein n=1 Tax=Flavobacterium araucananum TaxID=946678 RepID=A0A227P8E2_9FLAO|nr:hypothetical protein [Flavobacterium araucananum]OXG06159.1 hypothetical protein B0A64_11525 [Flavobacterium araucananum]PWK00620.1 hypothetical protein BC749_102184 [Flavobacterium araucananum]
MKTKNTEGLTLFEISQLIQQGGKFVVFSYTISMLVWSVKKNSPIYFIRPGENSLKYSFGYLLLNLTFGWWGFPFGPIYTISSLYHHIIGGKDCTHIILNDLEQNNPVYEPDLHYLQFA